VTLPLAGRVALVTGATRRAGIGAAIARALARDGASLVVTSHAAYDAAKPWGLADGEPRAVAAELAALGAEVESIEVDLAAPAAPRELVERAWRRFGRLDVLVNNAVHWEPSPIESLDAALLDRHHAVNVRAVLGLCAEFARRHPAGRSGRIVNLTSGQSLGPMPEAIAYAATKGAVEAVTGTLAKALGPRGITVNAVDPGATQTGWMNDALEREIAAATPLGRVGAPDDVARLVAFLASDAGAWITGQTLRSRGGL
jgi:3-oxoacyl-[acyl-carrier protein] reductase